MKPEDIQKLREEFLSMLQDEERLAECGYDDVVVSIGYVCLWTDGEVTQYGKLLGTLDEDGNWNEGEE
jgi:hypothetical protein